jgi:uncharacterized membrane protein
MSRKKNKNRNLPRGTTKPNGAVVPTVNSLPDMMGQPVPARNQQRSGGVIVTGEMYSGPLPHPEILRKFEEISPGAAKMILQKFEQQSDHRRDLESRVVRGQIRQADTGQWMAFGLLGTIILGGLFLAYTGRDMVGFGAIVTAVVGGVTLLWTAARAKKRDLADKGDGKGKR